MVGGNAARLYGFDLDALAPVAARVGPAVGEVATPLPADEVPSDARRCPAFAEVPGNDELKGTAWDASATAHGRRTSCATVSSRRRRSAPGRRRSSRCFETDPEVIAAVLPPPLEPPGEPLARVTIATVDMGRPVSRRSEPARSP